MRSVRVECFKVRPSADHDFELSIPLLEVKSDEWVVILGPSGCGKSTLLREILNGHRDITLGDELGRPGTIGYVSQTNTLWPWHSLKGNVTWSASQLGDVDDERVTTMLDRLKLGAHSAKHPGEASGGMQRRAMIARALLYQPALLILDEPFSGIDFATRKIIIDLLNAERTVRKFTCIAVLHEVSDAVTLADKIYYFNSEGLFVKEPFELNDDVRLEDNWQAASVDKLIQGMSA